MLQSISIYRHMELNFSQINSIQVTSDSDFQIGGYITYSIQAKPQIKKIERRFKQRTKTL